MMGLLHGYRALMLLCEMLDLLLKVLTGALSLHLCDLIAST
jgi:hypothetical protein